MRRASNGLIIGLLTLAVSACDLEQQQAAQSPEQPQAQPPEKNSPPVPNPVAAEAAQRLPASVNPEKPDPWLWLENITGTKSLQWVMARNRKTREVLEGDPRFDLFQKEALSVLTAADRVPYGFHRNGYVYNFWQDEQHVRGIWRRTTLESYRSVSPEWDILLDIDKLAAEENANWVLSGMSCLCSARMGRR
jgi:hypothetical protein